MLKREWYAESNGKVSHLFIPGKTVALVLGFSVEDIPSAQLQPWFLRFSEGLVPGQNTLMIMMVMMGLFNYFLFSISLKLIGYFIYCFINIMNFLFMVKCYSLMNVGLHRAYLVL